MSNPLSPYITVSDLCESAPSSLNITIVSGQAGLDRRITVPRVQKLGLALAGFSHYIHSGRPQIIGGSELSYLEQLDEPERESAVTQLPLDRMSCVLVTRGLQPPKELVSAAEQAGMPLLLTTQVSSLAILELTEFLQVKLAPSVSLHGVMVELFGLGVLLQGDSGIGKSECGLDLIRRGHRLISDDIVELRRVGVKLIGSAPLIVRNHMEIRGLGIINIKDLFGVSALAVEKQLDLLIRLVRWDPERTYDRLGLDDQGVRVLDIEVPLIEMPVASGRNLATLVEVAVRNHMLKKRGIHAAREFVARHTELIEGDS
ncbi:MAG TPA: HPr(Ser) kinase/phosphatase [Blastocatellia bacterium]|nr:HPr(Ser) kinase/phosphatase [Blastocatellia bacterium]